MQSMSYIEKWHDTRTEDRYMILTSNRGHCLIKFVLVALHNDPNAINLQRWKTFDAARTNRKWGSLLIQEETYRCTQAKTQTFLHTSRSHALGFRFKERGTHTHKSSWLSGGYASQPDSDVCAEVRRWCASKRSQEKNDEASLRVLCMLTGMYVRVSVCCSVASTAFYPHPLSRHNKRGWMHLSSIQA